MADCPFCQFAQEGLPVQGLYEDNSLMVILDMNSLGVGHCMVIPKQHVVQVFELDEQTYSALFLLAKKLAPYLLRATGSKAIGYVIFGSGLPHAHLHLVPHNSPQELERPQPKDLSQAELQANAAYLKGFLPEKL